MMTVKFSLTENYKNNAPYFAYSFIKCNPVYRLFSYQDTQARYVRFLGNWYYTINTQRHLFVY